jgi:hypothetical protein
MLLFVFFIPLVVKADETPPHLLAFALIESPGAFPTAHTVENHYGYIETIYVYNPEDDTLQKIGIGDTVRWSPSGRYLAMMDTVNEDPTAGKYFGQMKNFSVYDFATGSTFIRNYTFGNSVDWPPDETYLIASGSTSSGMSGVNSWIDFFNPDGSNLPPGQPNGFVSDMMNAHNGIFPVGWVGSGADGQLLARNMATPRDNYLLIDPVTNAQTAVKGDPPIYFQFNRRGFGTAGTAQSEDNRYAAVTRPARAWNVNQDFSTYLLIVDMNSGKTHEVSLPKSTSVVIAQMAWRPCNHDIYRPECYL